MNNGSIRFDPEKKPDIKPQLREREAKLIRILTAVEVLKHSEAWSTLTTELFADLATSKRRDLLKEAKKPDPNTNMLNRISGELFWAERYSDLNKLENEFRFELQSIKERLHEPG